MLTMDQVVAQTMIELRVLGDPQVSQDGVAVPLQRKPLAVLTYLALSEPGRFVQRDTLLGVFWPEKDQARARGALRQALHALREALGHEAILTEGDDNVAVNHAALRCDALEFERAISEGQLRTAVDSYGGALLSGLHLKGCQEFEYWLDGQRGPLERSYAEATEQLAAMARSKGDHRRAAEWLRRLFRLDPLQGRVAVLLMSELEASGDREEALRIGERYVADIAREWDAAPDPELRELLERLRTMPSRPAPSVVKPGRLRCEIEMVREAFAGRYDVLEELGGGALGKVFLAWDPKLKRHVAVKVLRPELRDTVGGERFLQEISIVAAFNHPNIVPLFEADEIAGFLYYAMRHIPGEPLSARLKREGHLPVDDAVRIARDVASGLEYSHQHGVIHRDIKPKNVLLHERNALITDFATAMAVAGGGKRFTSSGVWVGTPEYMSPELITSTGVVDRRSDVYALGCVLYEMLAGEPVFGGPTRHAVLAKHRNERVPSVRIVRPVVTDALEAIVLTALAKIPADRFPTAGALAHALDEL